MHRSRQRSQPASRTVALWGAVSPAVSIQRGTITIAAASTSNTATIGAVIPDNSQLLFLGSSSSEDGATSMSSVACRLVLTNATTITASRLSSTGEVIVSYEIVEYLPGVIRSVQRGTVTATAAVSGTATITAVANINRCTTTVLGWDYNHAQIYTASQGRVDLTNTTTVTLNRVSNNGNLTAGFQVIEWN